MGWKHKDMYLIIIYLVIYFNIDIYYKSYYECRTLKFVQKETIYSFPENR